MCVCVCVVCLCMCGGHVKYLEKKRLVQVGAEGIASGHVDRKLDLVVGELKRYGISVAGTQETKWFGKDVWSAAGGFTFLHLVDLSSLVVQI